MFGKARVAPMKALSIPKLELQAALLATRLKEEILKGLTFRVTDIFTRQIVPLFFSGLTPVINYPFLLESHW